MKFNSKEILHPPNHYIALPLSITLCKTHQQYEKIRPYDIISPRSLNLPPSKSGGQVHFCPRLCTLFPCWDLSLLSQIEHDPSALGTQTSAHFSPQQRVCLLGL